MQSEMVNFHVSLESHNFRRWAPPYKCGFRGSSPISSAKVWGRFWKTIPNCFALVYGIFCPFFSTRILYLLLKTSCRSLGDTSFFSLSDKCSKLPKDDIRSLSAISFSQIADSSWYNTPSYEHKTMHCPPSDSSSATPFIIFLMIFRARSLFVDMGRLSPASKAFFLYSFLHSSARPFHFSPMVLKTFALPPTPSFFKISLVNKL